MSDEKRQILEWLSPLTPRERHQTVSEGRVEGVGDWLLHTNEFEKWHTSNDGDVNPVLFCCGDPGVGKTHMRCVKVP
jgi:polynucleotide 5'-kinase involved in rRNA processing